MYVYIYVCVCIYIYIYRAGLGLILGHSWPKITIFLQKKAPFGQFEGYALLSLSAKKIQKFHSLILSPLFVLFDPKTSTKYY